MTLTPSILTSLEQLDAKLEEINSAWKISDDAVRAVFATFQMEIGPTDFDDPWSEKYATAQFDLYRKISSRKTYSTENEVSGFEVSPQRPFPYYTQSASTVGHQLMGIGFLISKMALAAKSSILEFGPGWGNTTIALARMGYEVTALDIDPNFTQLIKDRAKLLALDVDARVGAFFDAATIEKQFDAVLFYECFHHCSDHVKLLGDLHRVVKPNGKVFLAAEPIYEGFHAPWGIRLDGESLWAIRKNGWLELGFQESYFIETCMREGWSVTRHVSDVSHLASVFELSKLENTIKPGLISLPKVDDLTWAIPDHPAGGQRYTSSNSRLVLPVNKNFKKIALKLINPSPVTMPFEIEHGTERINGELQAETIQTIGLNYQALAGALRIRTNLWKPSDLIPGSKDERQIGIGVLEVELT
jgi:2-polyprenyl-3-methyl-5-hydroxy-6-metoxy-1,4-benzoquinol methylase